MTAAESIAEFALGLDFESIPAAVVERTQLHLLDVLGCALAAGADGAGTQAEEWALENERDLGPAELWHAWRSVSPAAAALANGMLAHALDFDDTHPLAMIHVSTVTAPAAVAIAQARGAGGRELITAMVAGAETTIRLGLAAPGEFHARGLHPTSVCGVFGATVAVARLLGLDRPQTVAALGIAGSTSSGLFEFLADGSSTKPFHAGWAAHAAVMAAGLAALGATGPATVLEGRFGMFRAVLGLARDQELTEQLSDLGERWETLEMAIKPYPACHLTHAAMDGARSLLDDGLCSEEIVAVRAAVPEAAVGIVLEPAGRKRRPTTPYEAKFSLPFCVSRMLVDGRVDAASFSSDTLSDGPVLDLMDRFSYQVVATGGRGPFFTILSVELRDGGVWTVDVPHPSGASGAPLSRDRVVAKFCALAKPRLGVATAPIAEMILSFSDADTGAAISLIPWPAPAPA
jgi:2-methylcitrate dehydratase PrpD